MHLDVSLACADGPSRAKISGEGCLKEGGVREAKRDKVSERDGDGDSLMLSGHREMCVTQSQIGNRCFNLASLCGYPLH